MIGGVAVPQLWFTLRLVVILGFVHRFRRSLFDQTGKFTGSLQLGDFVADLASRPAHETGDLLDRIIQPDAIGQVQKIHLRSFFAGIHVGLVFEILVHSRFPNFFVIQPNASRILLAPYVEGPSGERLPKAVDFSWPPCPKRPLQRARWSDTPLSDPFDRTKPAKAARGCIVCRQTFLEMLGLIIKTAADGLSLLHDAVPSKRVSARRSEYLRS